MIKYNSRRNFLLKNKCNNTEISMLAFVDKNKSKFSENEFLFTKSRDCIHFLLHNFHEICQKQKMILMVIVV